MPALPMNISMALWSSYDIISMTFPVFNYITIIVPPGVNKLFTIIMLTTLSPLPFRHKTSVIRRVAHGSTPRAKRLMSPVTLDRFQDSHLCDIPQYPFLSPFIIIFRIFSPSVDTLCNVFSWPFSCGVV